MSFRAEDGLQVDADDRLLRVALDNLIGNAWKFTRPVKSASVKLGSASHNGTRAYYIRDNGVGFEMEYKQSSSSVPAVALAARLRRQRHRSRDGAPGDPSSRW